MTAHSTLTPEEMTPHRQPTAARLTRKLAESPEAGVIIACVLVFVVIALNAPTYTATGNLQVMGRDLAQVGILAVGESVVILTGGIDLSVGALAGLAGILTAWFNVNHGMPAPLAILATLLICAAVGLWHGTMVTRLNVPPFVITLVTFTVAQGMALAITTGTPINNISPLFSNLSQFYVGEVPVPALVFIGAAATRRPRGWPVSRSPAGSPPPTSPVPCSPASSASW